ncbi:hypothetical protein M409DRAFT_20383 [Zasmidium cellare ATCC 36951]|uniref:Ubiquitin-like modifier HUB1 n=1 Tax=Zasmidium cellare ATCC 36951 TaxID=1080233 RepID=A0A6A6CTQ3_ZASCE|nr:uncharacterized protein M409DRAFT_20383 [Zasmidium cellare ATCC 36951]KAF2169159.1 hypothetical protein M409DRAFT_20383 [Zasmidium cellare ATCC 36951]
MASDDERSRSASPAREPKPKKSKTSGGFRWKEKRPRDEEPDSRSSGRLERGYRDRSPKRDSYRDSRDERREDERPRRRDNDDRDRDEDRPARRRDAGDSYRPGNNTTTTSSRDEEIKRKFGDTPTSTSTKDAPTTDPKPAKKDKKSKPPKQITTNEPMIIVNVNDRLGTKAAIPCLASDSVKAFKAMVAAHIGRQPHEIMIKRQGERPFKDVLSLEDYGVSSGVQLDLELDTGD